MTLRESVNRAIAQLSEGDVEQVAQYVAFLQNRSRVAPDCQYDDSILARSYAQATDEDHKLAELGLLEYSHGLTQEDIA